MTDTKLLRELIKRSGLKIGFIAHKMGISRATLSGKINNRSAFNQFEIEKLCNLLSIHSIDLKEAVFLLQM